MAAAVLLISITVQAGTTPASARAEGPAVAAVTAPSATDPVVAMATTTDGRGSWVARSSGRVEVHGTAAFHGDLASARLTAPIVALAATPSRAGYWMVARRRRRVHLRRRRLPRVDRRAAR